MNTTEIRVERVRRGITPGDMADLLGITKQGYFKKENGINAFRTDDIIKIVNAWDLSPKRMNVIFFDGKLPFGTEN